MSGNDNLYSGPGSRRDDGPEVVSTRHLGTPKSSGTHNEEPRTWNRYRPRLRADGYGHNLILCPAYDGLCAKAQLSTAV